MGHGWNKDRIVKEIKDEGYEHNFFFGQGQEYDFLTSKVDFADEVWCFGDCVGYEMYDYAKSTGCDLWVMGE